jgi:iron(II)-dependent oxidoreductase
MLSSMPEDAELSRWVADARARTFELVADLSDEQLLGPRLAIVNPLRWEIGHVAWFQEKWILRDRRGARPYFGDADALYDSSAIPHDVRWDLPLPSRADTLAFLHATRDRVLELIAGGLTDEDRYFVQLCVFHEDMHDEAFIYTRQTLAHPAPVTRPAPPPRPVVSGDLSIAGGPFLLGAARTDGFVFDNEKWAHPVEVKPFSIARALVTQGELAAFTDDGGYRRRDLWSEEGWQWRQSAVADGPVYWKREGRDWQRRHFDRWVPLEPQSPMRHVSWFEAQAFCAWAGRRLPTELEWEVAAAAGESGSGCRELTGQVWQWTESVFLPYPGFEIDPYRDYSKPWFGTHRVLRGGCWATQPRLLRKTWRNFYTPDRRDVWAGFRTCAR